MEIKKPDRLAEIQAMPADIADYALVDWRTVATLLAAKDIEHARQTVIDAGVPLVHVSDRRKLPRWGALKEFIRSRESAR